MTTLVTCGNCGEKVAIDALDYHQDVCRRRALSRSMTGPSLSDAPSITLSARSIARHIRDHQGDPNLAAIIEHLCETIEDQASGIQRLLEDKERLNGAVVALADGADKCALAPHFIVQPFLNIYRDHGETIATARTTLSGEGA